MLTPEELTQIAELFGISEGELMTKRLDLSSTLMHSLLTRKRKYGDVTGRDSAEVCVTLADYLLQESFRQVYKPKRPLNPTEIPMPTEVKTLEPKDVQG